MGRHAEDWGERVEIRIQRSHGDEEGGEGGSDAKTGQGTSRWEWVVAALGALVVLGSVGLMLYEGLAHRSTPPQIEVAVDSVFESSAGNFAVQLRVRNQGQSTAAGLVLQGELRSDTGVVETSQVTIDYVPAGSRRRAGLFFSHDPRLFELQVRPMGYDIP